METKDLSTLIRTKRLEKGLTQKELAALVHVTESAISKWEHGAHMPDTAIMDELCRVLGIPFQTTVISEEPASRTYKRTYFPRATAFVKKTYSLTKDMVHSMRIRMDDTRFYFCSIGLNDNYPFRMIRRTYQSETYSVLADHDEEFLSYFKIRWNAHLVLDQGNVQLYRNDSHMFDIRLERQPKIEHNEWVVFCNGWFGKDPKTM